MDLKNEKVQLDAENLEILKDFQMEELEERMEMGSWIGDETVVDTAGPGANVPPATPSNPTPTTPGTTPVGGVTVHF